MVELHSRAVFVRTSLIASACVWLCGIAHAAGLAAGAAELPPGFVDLADVAPDVVVDMRYAGADNFLGRPARGYGDGALPPHEGSGPRAGCRSARAVARSALGLKVYDCYRPQRAVDDFVAWSRAPGAGDGSAPSSGRAEERAVAARLHRGALGAQPREHGRPHVDRPAAPLRRGGRAADATATRSTGPQAPDASLNMGTTFDCFDERAHAASDAVSSEARRNRLLLRMAMEKHGFVAYAHEWWHFTLANEPFPKTAFDFEIRRAP